MSVSSYHHVIPTWEVYPRVYFFQKRYKDIHERFLNILNKAEYPVLFKNTDVLNNLQELKSKLQKPLKINVIGRKILEEQDLVITTEPLKRLKHKTDGDSNSESVEEGFSIVVVYVCVRDFGQNGLKEVEATVRHVLGCVRKASLFLFDSLLIVCQTSMTCTAHEHETFRTRVQEYLKNMFNLHVHADSIVVGTHNQMISTTISQVMEAEIIQGLLLMRRHLNGFLMNGGCLNKRREDVSETKHDLHIMQSFLKDRYWLVDILYESKKQNQPFVKIVLSHMAQMIRCATLGPLSKNMNLPGVICNQLAFELKFEEDVIKSLSKNEDTLNHISKLELSTEKFMPAIKEGNRYRRFPGQEFTPSADLNKDIRSDFQRLEKELSSLQRTTSVMKRMVFELNGVIKQSVTKTDEMKKADESVSVPKQFKDEILEVGGVYGAGTLFGQFEIHFETEKAKEKVQNILHRYKLERIVSLRKVSKKANDLAGPHVEHGVPIYSTFSGQEMRFRSGTLGMFLNSNNGELYALTCAHVIFDSQYIYIRNRNGENEIFATRHENFTALPGSQPYPLVDIAAIQVESSHCPNCTKFLKDDDGMMKSPELSEQRSGELAGQYIYKYGAASHLTRGLVCSEDYNLAKSGEDYLILIACSPGCDESKMYAQPGDSGSINCVSNVETNKTVKAVSMLSAGDLKLEGLGEGITISFLLSVGLQKLKDRYRGTELSVPNMYNTDIRQELMY